MLNSCIEVSDYNEPYSLCQPLLPSPQSTLGLTRAKPSGIPPPLHGGTKADYKNFVVFLKELRAALGSKSGITVTLPSSYWYLQHFDIAGMEEYLDWFKMMSKSPIKPSVLTHLLMFLFIAYDIHGKYSGCAHPLPSTDTSPQVPGTVRTSSQRRLCRLIPTSPRSIRAWISSGATTSIPRKLY